MDHLAARMTPSSPHSAALRVAIVGGGWAGMAAAVELAAAGAQVTVFESGRVLGGRARRVEIDGVTLDNGLHILIGAYRETLRLIGTVQPPGAPLGLARSPLRLQVGASFRLHAFALPAPLHLAAGLLFARGLSAAEKLAAVRFLRQLKRSGFRCDATMTVANLLGTLGQPPRLSALLWAPLCIATLNTRPAQASAQVFLNVLRDSIAAGRSDSDLLLPTMDFSALFPERAKAFVEARGGEIRCAVAVRRVESRDGTFAIDGEAGYRRVILAVGPHRLDSVAAGIPELVPLAATVNDLQYHPIYSIYLQYAEPVRLPEPMVGFTGGLAQWAFDRGTLCGQPGLIGVVISGDGPHEAMAHEALARAVHEELVAQFPLLGVPRWQRVIAEKRATFACLPGLSRPRNATPVPGLFLAGDYTEADYPATLETAVRSGVAAARLALGDRG
jgi:hydroxysqualene dehydroxylase